MVQLIGGYDTNTKASQVAMGAVTTEMMGTKTSLHTSNIQLAMIIDDYTTANITYFGYAITGSLTSNSVWCIKIFDETGDYLVVKYADGNSDFDNEFDNRASLSYS